MAIRRLSAFINGMPAPVFIIGHKNPDADAICSAIGYCAYKRARGEAHVEAARCGNSNARIDAILKRFGVPLPRFIGDVTPRVRDIMVRKVIKVRADSICAEALDLIDRHDVRFLPVVDDSNHVQGALSIFDLGEYFIPKPRQETRMRYVYTSLDDIVRALNAEVIHLHESNRLEELFVRVGAMDVRSFGRHYMQDEALARSSVIIVGDRYDIQQRAIQSGVRALVITGGLPVEPDVVQMAKERSVSIIVSQGDSATTSWLIRSAARVERMMSRKFITFSPDEKLSIVRRKISTIVKDSAAYLVVDDQDTLLGIFTKTDLLKPIQTSLILVDHNELSQAVPGAEMVNILEIIDHHRLGNQPTQQPILFINAPWGSTSTIVADLFQRQGLKPSPPVAGVLMGGIISDTLNLRGPTTTQRDIEMVDWLSAICEVPADELAGAIFSSGSIILSVPPEDVIRADMKEYTEGEISYVVSQIEELGFDNFWSQKDQLEEALETVRASEGHYFAALLITDINTQNSLLLVKGAEEFIDALPYPRREQADVFELNNIVSRKKQVIPMLTSTLRSVGVGPAPANTSTA